MSNAKTTAIAPPLPPADPADATRLLVLRAKDGDDAAVNALLRRHLPPLARWARGRLPAGARGPLDTCDLVQDAAFRALGRLRTFEPRQPGSLQAYLRRAVMNRVRDEVRRARRRPAPVALEDNHASIRTNPLETIIRREAQQRYGNALLRLRPGDRRLIVARAQLGWSFEEMAQRFGLCSAAAARMATTRATRRLQKLM
jgi:RNA polymerase sigma factor (sigma-70 family)